MTLNGLKFTISETPPDNRGWMYLQLNAFDGDASIGYLKVTWIPQQNFDMIYKTPWHYAMIIEGKWSFDPSKSLEAFWKSVMDSTYKKFHNTDETPSRQQMELDLSSIEIRYKKRMDTFQGYQVDRPYVAYAFIEEPWRRKGFGRKLYYKMAEILAERGLALHSASTQTDAARAFWASIDNAQRIPIPNNDESCFVLDFR